MSLRTSIQTVSQAQFFQVVLYSRCFPRYLLPPRLYVNVIHFSSMLHKTLFYEFNVCKLIDFIIIAGCRDTQLIIAVAFVSHGRLQQLYQSFCVSKNDCCPLLTKIILFGV